MDIPGVKAAEPFYANTIVWKHPQTRQETTVQLVDLIQTILRFLPEVNQQ